MALRVRDKDRKASASGTASPSVHTMKITSSKSGKCSKRIIWELTIPCHSIITRHSVPVIETTIGPEPTALTKMVAGGGLWVLAVCFAAETV